ncbi:unnamed protein product [Polarella glacialis]|uniref:Uncharacterized protein n=1 Tax=Polarella glacialis TaxID=89957 RepID=A0A813JXI8_POLGL|nr:unnamed protein product [Polarella glacialis]
MAAKPLMLKAVLAAWTALVQPPRFLAYLFLATALAALETTLPALFFVSFSLVRPPPVFTLVPRKTEDLARLPLAIVDFFMAFFFMTFFITFLIAFFIAFFIAVAFIAAFMVFIGRAMFALRLMNKGSNAREGWFRKALEPRAAETNGVMCHRVV